jgi:WD40 repeat protein
MSSCLTLCDSELLECRPLVSSSPSLCPTHVIDDHAVRAWNVRPFAPGVRLERMFTGAQHNFEKNLIKVAWTPDGRHIGAGSSDRSVRSVYLSVCLLVCLSVRVSIVCLSVHMSVRMSVRVAFTLTRRRMVYVWNYQSGQLVYRLPGHKGCTNDIDFHPSEPIGLLSVCLFV